MDVAVLVQLVVGWQPLPHFRKRCCSGRIYRQNGCMMGHAFMYVYIHRYIYVCICTNKCKHTQYSYECPHLILFLTN